LIFRKYQNHPTMKNEKMIGIVGGVGPYAGLDLIRKIFDQTEAKTDQEHLPVALISLPEQIEDRTAFIAGKTNKNPAYGIIDVINKLSKIGASVVGIACNSAHAPQIFNVVVEEIEKAGIKIKLLHIIDEVAKFLKDSYPQIKRVGILGTIGTAKTGIYETALKRDSFEVIPPDELFQKKTHNAVYDQDFGIKAQSNPVTGEARSILMEAIAHLNDNKAEAVVLGCTEMPIAIPEFKINKIAIIDPTLILARALIRESNPIKLKPFDQVSNR